MKSILTNKQTLEFTKTRVRYEGELVDIIAHVRYDDHCGNGHNSFAITADVYLAGKRGDRNMICCGCVHDAVIKHFPQLAPLVKWHHTSSDGPMHYIANTLYHARTTDCNGLEKDEVRQIKNGRSGLNVWKAVTHNAKGEEFEIRQLGWVDSAEMPEDDGAISWIPVTRTGEGKDSELEAARSSAVWPEAKLEDFTQEKLEARLPQLMREFRSDVESLGMVY